jgi:hypothetical protein
MEQSILADDAAVRDAEALAARVAELEAFVRRVAREVHPWGDPTGMIDLADDAAALLAEAAGRTRPTTRIFSEPVSDIVAEQRG